MIAALLLGRKGSVGFPGKNLYPILGRPLMEYPLLAAVSAKKVDSVYVSTDDEQIMDIGRRCGAEIIVRPPELASKTALGEHAYVHGYRVISEKLKAQSSKLKREEIELMVLLFCNAATILADTIDRGIEILRENQEYDSAVTASSYNMWSPLRARKIGDDGLLHPFVPFEVFGDPATLNCDRDSQGDVWFADMGVSIVRPSCLEHLERGLLPQKWMGQKIYPLKQWGGCDVDYEGQIPGVEYWLIKNGFTENRTPYERA
ncbi:MAG: cytidylyltransferase [Deltaproteobacteria bacterium]|nr:cytidylyltransferase [Deltaproteobacteria bacterium]